MIYIACIQIICFVVVFRILLIIINESHKPIPNPATDIDMYNAYNN